MLCLLCLLRAVSCALPRCALPGLQYLVKWKGLPYSEATWERVPDVEKAPAGPVAIAEFKVGAGSAEQAFVMLGELPVACLGAALCESGQKGSSWPGGVQSARWVQAAAAGFRA